MEYDYISSGEILDEQWKQYVHDWHIEHDDGTEYWFDPDSMAERFQAYRVMSTKPVGTHVIGMLMEKNYLVPFIDKHDVCHGLIRKNGGSIVWLGNGRIRSLPFAQWSHGVGNKKFWVQGDMR